MIMTVGAEDETRTHTALTATAPSTLRVYQFHHLGTLTVAPSIIVNPPRTCLPTPAPRPAAMNDGVASPLVHQVSAADVEGLASYVFGGVRSQENRRIADVLRRLLAP